MFPVESLYDSWSVPNILGISCINSGSLQDCSQSDRAALEVYHKSTESVLNDITVREGNGAWSPACSNHCYMHASAWTNSNNFAVPYGSNYTIHRSVQEWYNKIKSGENYTHVDRSAWPSNTGCAGKHTQ